MELFDKKFVYFMWDDSLKNKKGFTAPTIRLLIDCVENSVYVNHWQEFEESHDTDLPFHSITGADYAFAYYDPLYDVKLAWKNGKQIQYRYRGEDDDGWDDTNKPCWDNNTFEYRVKPASKMWTACIDNEGIVSVMPAREWNKNKGRQLIEGTKEKCEVFAVENYCNKCAYHAACVGHKCIMNLDMWYCQGFRELKAVHRMTNRELAQWVWQGNGQVKYRDGYYTLIACTAYDIRDDNKPCPDYYVIRGWDETEWHEPEVEEE